SAVRKEIEQGYCTPRTDLRNFIVPSRASAFFGGGWPGRGLPLRGPRPVHAPKRKDGARAGLPPRGRWWGCFPPAPAPWVPGPGTLPRWQAETVNCCRYRAATLRLSSRAAP